MSSTGFQQSVLDGHDEVLDCSAGLAKVSLAERLQGKKYLLVYFSANWCGPCRRFTPLLARWYEDMKDAVEVLFASSCDDAEAFQTYAQKHPWLALPYEVSQAGGFGYVRSAVREATGAAQGKLATLCEVSSVPTLGVFEVSSGALICANGRSTISTADNGPDGELPAARYADPASVLTQWVAAQHSWLPSGAAATGALVVEPGQMEALLREPAMVSAARSGQLFVLLVASADPATGVSWYGCCRQPP
jgi:thiol-disulfide isomerase/thioredoxin